MPLASPARTAQRLLLLAACCLAGATVPALGAIGSSSYSELRAGAETTMAAEPARVRVAQSQEAAQLRLQIQQLQEQIRELTGQVEGLQFQMTQMQTLITRTNEDNEFRFQALEGGEPGKPQAATESGGAMPAAELPQPPAQNPAAQDAAPVEADPLPPESGNGAPMDSLGDSQDPMIGGDGASDATLGTLPGNQPLNLSLDAGAGVANPDAQAQYQAGYEAIIKGDYGFAEDQFQQFVALYPDDPQAPDATNWLGEALLQRGAYSDAALVLAEGYQKYQASARAPDLLLKLGIALNGAEEPQVACRTFATLEERHTGLSAAFQQRLDEEKQRAQCPL